MRVNIRYSVDDKELLNETHTLFLKAHDKFNSTKDLVIRQMLHSSVLKETDKMSASITELRKAMYSFDLSLGEIQTILEGYSQYENGELPPQMEEQASKQTSSNNKYSALGDISELLEAMNSSQNEEG